MKAKFSPLALEEFELLALSYNFNIPKKEGVEVSSLFKTYKVDINFNHHFLDNGGIQLFVRIEVNLLKNPKDGYSIMSEGVGMFAIENDSTLDESLLGNLSYYSTLNMMINNLRNVMFQTSTIGPLGGYLLPPIDIMDLFKKKNKLVKAKKNG